MEIDFGQSLPKQRNISLDPRTKIFITITVSCILIEGGTAGIMSIVRLFLSVMPLVLLICSKKGRLAFKYGIVYFLAYMAELTLIPRTVGIVNFLIVALVGMISHVMPGIIMGLYLVITTEVSDFIASMEKMHVSNKITIPMSVMFRFFPTVIEEFHCIKNAMKMRGLLSFSMIKNIGALLEYLIVPMMISLVKIGEELTVASLTRGLGGDTKRTNICNIGFNTIDILFFIISIFAWICFIASKWRM